MKWFNDGNRIAQVLLIIIQGSEDLSVKIWDIREGLKVENTLGNYTYFPLSLDSDESDNYILTSSKGFDGIGCEVKLWDLRKMSVVYNLTGHSQDTTSCCIINKNNNLLYI